MMQLCGLDDQVWRGRSGVVLTRPVRARCPPGRCNRSDAGVSPVTVGQQRAPAIGFGPRDSPKPFPTRGTTGMHQTITLPP